MEFDICRQLEDIYSDIGPEYHNKKCLVYIYRKDAARNATEDIPCSCAIGKHEEKILILKSKIQSALELFGIELNTTLIKYFGEE